MSRDDKGKNGPDLDVTYQLLQGIRGFSDSEAGNKPLLFNDLVRFVCGDAGDSQRIELAIESKPELHSQYLKLLHQHGRLFSPKQRAAASSDESSSRQGEGFIVSWVQPENVEGQVYVVLQVDNDLVKKDGDSIVLHVTAGTLVSRQRFPKLFDNKTQIILRPGHKLLELLKDRESIVGIV